MKLMQTKPAIIVAAIVFIGLGLLVFHFRGAIPAIFPSASNISQLVKTDNSPLLISDGLKLDIIAQDLSKPRDLLYLKDDVLFVTETTAGKVTAVNPNTGDKTDVITGLASPHGLELHCIEDGCRLYVAETAQVSSYLINPDDLSTSFERKLTDLPDDGGHYTRSLLLADKDTLLVSIGSKCNVCIEEDERRSAVIAIDLKTDQTRIFASGLRNSVFMKINPATGQIWATENGRDNLGDDLPPDEVNILTEGNDYGWPYCYGDKIPDTDFATDAEQICQSTVGAHIDLQAHSAALGLDFFNNDWGELSGDLLVAYHGSWNRSVPTGYKIVRFVLDDSGQVSSREDFMSGWLQNLNALGRPVDIEITSDTIYISDDHAGVIYSLQKET